MNTAVVVEFTHLVQKATPLHATYGCPILIITQVLFVEMRQNPAQGSNVTMKLAR